MESRAATSARLSPQIPSSDAAAPSLSAAQLELHEKIVADRSKLGGASGAIPVTMANGSLSGPWNAMVASPTIGALVEATARACRHASRCPRDLAEVAILCAGAHWKSQFEWYAHERLALRHGVSAEAIALIKRSVDAAELVGAMDVRQLAVYAWASELQATRRASDAAHAAALEAVGSEGALVDLVWTLGFYHQISLALNAFDVALPPGCGAPPFADV